MTSIVDPNQTPRPEEIYSADPVPDAHPIPVAYPLPPNMDPRLLNSNNEPIPQYYFVHPNIYNSHQPIGHPVYAQQFVPHPPPVTVIEHKVVEHAPDKQPETQIAVIEETRVAPKKRGSPTVWILFGLGFIVPFLWWGGIGHMRSSNKSDRIGGILCLIFAILSAAAVGIIVYVIRFT